MSNTEAGSLAEWLMSGEPPKTHEQRVWWHEYKTHDGIHEHAERIASLEELVEDMWLHSYCSIAKTREDDERHIEDVIDRMHELGLEVE